MCDWYLTVIAPVLCYFSRLRNSCSKSTEMVKTQFIVLMKKDMSALRRTLEAFLAKMLVVNNIRREWGAAEAFVFVYYIVLSSMKEINVKDYTIGTYLQHTCCFCSAGNPVIKYKERKLCLCVQRKVSSWWFLIRWMNILCKSIIQLWRNKLGLYRFRVMLFFWAPRTIDRNLPTGSHTWTRDKKVRRESRVCHTL